MGIWRLIAHHDDPYRAIEEMKDRSRIAIGWTAIGDLRQLDIQGPSGITALISDSYPELDNAHLGGPSLWNLYQNMKLGDLVILNARSRRVCVLEVTGPYIYEEGLGQVLGYAHQRPACLTDLNPDDLWNRSGFKVSHGQNVRWTLAECSEPATAKDAIYKEGLRYSILSTAIERNPVARPKYIDQYGCRCFVCSFDFRKTYGELGDGYIHVHHRTDISKSDGVYEVDPIRDLVPLCPNCHAMIHRRSTSISVEELAAIYSLKND
ncbi:HNH endonuclease [Arenimonas sp.]|uniref:HNH endonuclease n=1 Tax=Arenimonas sp. TaxID=1872635 RepID=UPI0025C16315|nr:HNH endonuclease [Arenimonas sp.]